MTNYFTDLAAVDCSRSVEKKGRFTYLSWPFAITELLKRHPDATWRVIENAEGWPYWATPAGVFVKVAVTVNAIERTQVHPVLDANNRTVTDPNAFQINTSIQRGLVKAIALHGLGLSIYAGEDIAHTDEVLFDTQPWEAKIAASSTRDDLIRVGHDLTGADMPAGARDVLRRAYAERLTELTGDVAA